MGSGWIASFLLLASWTPPPMFAVRIDEPVMGGFIYLNGGSAQLMKNLDGAYWAKWVEKDATGRIVVHFPDGKRVSCEISYVVGKSPQMQRYNVINRRCFRNVPK